MSSLDPCGFEFEACLSIQGKTESLGTAEQWEQQNSSVFLRYQRAQAPGYEYEETGASSGGSWIASSM